MAPQSLPHQARHETTTIPPVAQARSAARSPARLEDGDVARRDRARHAIGPHHRNATDISTGAQRASNGRSTQPASLAELHSRRLSAQVADLEVSRLPTGTEMSDMGGTAPLALGPVVSTQQVHLTPDDIQRPHRVRDRQLVIRGRVDDSPYIAVRCGDLGCAPRDRHAVECTIREHDRYVTHLKLS